MRLAYAIGVAQPVSIGVDTYGTGKLSDEEIISRIEHGFDLTSNGIINCLNLRHPIYKQTAAYGHFGRTDIEIALVQAKIVYNKHGWHDPEGRFFVLREELERHGGLEAYIRKVEKQEIRVEPLVIRANAGDCIELRTTNLLLEYLEANAFQLRTRTDIAGHHVHLVKFDTIVSDGAANGWNNIAGARKYETLVERFFCG